MTTAEHAQTARTGTCPTSDELKQYLAGWSDETQSEQLEKHLRLCTICEAAIGQMETRPDTLLQSLQSTVAAPVASPVARSVSDRDSAAPSLEASSPPENDSPINAALAKAKQLMDAPVETPADKARTAWQPMQRKLGMYELLKPLGRGGMGAVYLATHKQLKKQVAIKLLPILSSEDSDVRARFDREIRVVGKLNHPSIVTATDAGEIDGTQFLVMEYVPGLDLSRLARLMGRLPVADACELIRQAALGLSCAHAEGVVHRDVKPSNLMLDESGQIRILDFGLAQLSVWDEASVDLTTVGQLMGTLDYMAPEQAEISSGVDYRADLYALGATLFRLLCGRAPLAAAPNQSPFEKLRLLANHQPPKLSTLCPEAPEELVKLVASLLSRNPSDRPASAAHVAEQLAPFAEGSKLVELLQQAQAKAALSPELLKKSAFPDHPPFLSPALASLAPLPASSGSGRSKILRRLLLAASLPVLIIAGILIKLETSKGQLVIESDVDNVSIKLLKDGKPVDGIQVSHGTTSTRLNADNYEITIDGPSDGLVIDNDKFTLKNGETVVARITRTPDSSNLAVVEAVRPAGETATSITFADPVQAMKHKLQELLVERELQRQKLGDDHPRVQTLEYEIEHRQQQLDDLAQAEQVATKSARTESPLYEGKPLEHWLDMLSRERSVVGLKAAIDGCAALVAEDNAGAVTDALLKVLPGLDGDSGFSDKETNSVWNLDYEAGELLRKANPGSKFLEVWVKVRSQSTDKKWNERLLKLANYRKLESPDDVVPLVEWGRAVLTESDKSNRLDPSLDEHAAMDAAVLLRNLSGINYFGTNQPFVDVVAPILTESPKLDDAWWLSEPLMSRGSNGMTELWPTPTKAKISETAVRVLEKADSDSSLVVQACMILANGAVLTEEQKVKVLTSIQRRLEGASKSPETLTEMVSVKSSFRDFAAPSFGKKSKLGIANLRIGDGSSSDASLVLQLLNTVSAIDHGKVCQPQVQMIFESSRGVFDIINAQRLADPASHEQTKEGKAGFRQRLNRYPLDLYWPSLTAGVDESTPIHPGGFEALQAIAFKTLWGEHVPSKQDWLKYLILLHPAMQDVVTAEIEKSM
jgi:serine/threonine protein kinase